LLMSGSRYYQGPTILEWIALRQPADPLLYIAIWAVATGVLEIVAAIRLRKEVKGEWLLILTGLASVVFGVLLMAQPGAGALALVRLIGFFALVFGVLLVILAFKARSFSREVARSPRLSAHHGSPVFTRAQEVARCGEHEDWPLFRRRA